ncbi:sodium:solute symporter family transporter, partial [Brevibacterium epidermidis]
ISYFSQHADMEPADAETVFLDLAQILFHPFIAGLVLAAVLAAIMSTISSQLVVTSSALIEDLFKIVALRAGSTRTLQDKTYVLLGRLGVLVVAIIAVVLAISPSNSILDLVAFAWAGFGASFGPIVLLTLFWKRLSNWGALFGLLSGAVVAFVWGQVSTPMTDAIYEIIPGFAVNLIVAVVVSRFTFKHDEASDVEFDESVALSRVK